MCWLDFALPYLHIYSLYLNIYISTYLRFISTYLHIYISRATPGVPWWSTPRRTTAGSWRALSAGASGAPSQTCPASAPGTAWKYFLETWKYFSMNVPPQQAFHKTPSYVRGAWFCAWSVIIIVCPVRCKWHLTVAGWCYNISESRCSGTGSWRTWGRDCDGVSLDPGPVWRPWHSQTFHPAIFGVCEVSKPSVNTVWVSGPIPSVNTAQTIDTIVHSYHFYHALS